MKYAIQFGYPVKITDWDILGTPNDMFGDLTSFIYEVPEEMRESLELESHAYGNTDPDFFEEISEERYNELTK